MNLEERDLRTALKFVVPGCQNYRQRPLALQVIDLKVQVSPSVH